MDSDKSIAACQPKIKKYETKLVLNTLVQVVVFWISMATHFVEVESLKPWKKTRVNMTMLLKCFGLVGLVFLRAEAFNKLVVLIGTFLLIWKKLTYVEIKNKGYKIMCEPKSSVFHVGGGTLSSGSIWKLI